MSIQAPLFRPYTGALANTIRLVSHRSALLHSPFSGSVWYSSTPGQPSKPKFSRTGVNLTLTAAAGAAGYWGWRSYSSKMASHTESPVVFRGGEQGFFPLRLEESHHISPNTIKLRFAYDDKNSKSGMSVASALVVRSPEGAYPEPVLRPYTPLNLEDDKGFLDLLVKVYPNAKMGTAFEKLKPGDTIEFKGPVQKYPYQPNMHEHIGMVAGGTGIAPMYQIIRKILNDPADRTRVTLLYGNVTEQDILLREEIDKLSAAHPDRFQCVYLLDKPPAKWTGKTGYVTKELLKEHMPSPTDGNKSMLFVCGPPGMYQAISGPKKAPLSGHLKDLGFEEEQVLKL